MVNDEPSIRQLTARILERQGHRVIICGDAVAALAVEEAIDLLIVASNDSSLAAPDWSVLKYPLVAADLARFRPITPEALEGALLGTRAAFLPAVRSEGPTNSDFFPVLDLGAERTRFRKLSASGFMGVTEDRFDVLAALEGRRIGFGVETREGLRLPRTKLRARGARLRAHAPAPASDAIDSDRDYGLALQREGTLRDVLGAPHAPTDWLAWFRSVLEVERDLHAGVSGVVDSVFYRDIDTYMDRWQAPEAARGAWRFMRAAGTYDWPGVAAELTPQLEARVAGRTWLNVDLLRDAGVVALLHAGERERARKVFISLARASTRGFEDLRTVVLQQAMVGK